ncbi:hypothetical protein BH09MYX1_BH09MYX1_66460 [soil metagenome]
MNSQRFPLASIGFALALPLTSACASTPAARSQAVASDKLVRDLQGTSCVGLKSSDNVFGVVDGECLCYDPPWDGGTRRPNEAEEQARSDFDGVLLCRKKVGATPSAADLSAVDPRSCPAIVPSGGFACSDHDQMLRNGYCLYVAADMKALVHERCVSGRWAIVSEDEVRLETMNRP